MKNEFKLLANIVSKYLPPEYPYDVVGGARNIKQADFDDRIDIVPVADPNIFSMSQELHLHKHNYKSQHLIHSYTTCIKSIETCIMRLV